MKETSPAQMLRLTSTEVVKRRSVRSNANVLNRRSWPLAPGSFRQQLRWNSSSRYSRRQQQRRRQTRADVDEPGRSGACHGYVRPQSETVDQKPSLPVSATLTICGF
ncbi:hypothetical protein Btru_049857 [Bulinus truncatus]|nr:hypothetical protein Btru_049857 [Bulinus truncatus]